MQLAPPRKREREDDEEFEELRRADVKRRQIALDQQHSSPQYTPPHDSSLPLRSYQQTSPPLFSHQVVITPNDSADESGDDLPAPLSNDMDMDDGPLMSALIAPSPALASSPIIAPPNTRWPPSRRAAQSSAPPVQSPFLNPPSIDASISGGRMPTPMHGSFPMKAAMLSLSPQNESMIDESISPRQRFPKPPELFIRPEVPHRKRLPDLTHDSGFPSPISEAEVDTPTFLAGRQLSQLSVEGDDGMDVDVENGVVDRAADGSPPEQRPRRSSGRARSGAITARGRFVMGRREDCEKCRDRVPGHLAHWN